MIHPMQLRDLAAPGGPARLRVAARFLPDALLRALAPHVGPMVVGAVRGIRLADGRDVEVELLGAPMLPDQIGDDPPRAVAVATEGARLALRRGARAFGLGAHWSTVGDKGRAVQTAVPDLPVTNGGAYTAAAIRAAIPEIVARQRAARRNAESETSPPVAVVGANGVVAFGVARLLAPRVARLLLVGRRRERLERSAATLARRHPEVRIETSTDLGSLRDARVIVTATSAPTPPIAAEHLAPGAWIYDLGRPSDVSAAAREVPGVTVIPGGVVRPPGRVCSEPDLGFGAGCVPACLAETVLLAADPSSSSSLGDRTRSAAIERFAELGDRLGFTVLGSEPPRRSGAAAR